MSLVVPDPPSASTLDFVTLPMPRSGLSTQPGEIDVPRVEETIPDRVAAEAEAARAWFAREQGGDFRLTGIVDPEESLSADAETGARELQLILCGRQDGPDSPTRS